MISLIFSPWGNCTLSSPGLTRALTKNFGRLQLDKEIRWEEIIQNFYVINLLPSRKTRSLRRRTSSPCLSSHGSARLPVRPSAPALSLPRSSPALPYCTTPLCLPAKACTLPHSKKGLMSPNPKVPRNAPTFTSFFPLLTVSSIYYRPSPRPNPIRNRPQQCFRRKYRGRAA